MKKPRADWEEDLDFNVEEEQFYDDIEEDEDDSMEDMDPPEGTEYDEEEDDFFADETDDDDHEALNDGFLVDGESSLDVKGDDDLEEQMYAETDETDELDDKS
ncbi:MAG: hypothetical protein SPF89_00705 [Sphaerochaetaceae bacterium]|nr:hypothetical protein [Spirochaetales bacterium]MDY5498603.1 hypothetical protein [Sphaerochaetaceae bacterium]